MSSITVTTTIYCLVLNIFMSNALPIQTTVSSIDVTASVDTAQAQTLEGNLKIQVMTELLNMKMEESVTIYCPKVHMYLVGVDQFTTAQERCNKFYEDNIKWMNFRDCTEVSTGSPINMEQMIKLYEDLQYFVHFLRSTVQIGLESLKEGCIVDYPTSHDPCVAVSCPKERQPEQELYCQWHKKTIPTLEDTILVMNDELNITNVNPTFAPFILPHVKNNQIMMRFYSVIIAAHARKEFGIAFNIAQQFLQ